MSIHEAILSGRPKQVRLLLAIGVGINTRNVRGQTPLMSACLHTDEEMAVKLVKLLLHWRADKSRTDKHKRHAFSHACQLGRESIVAVLLKDIDFDLNEQDLDGNTPLMYAAMHGHAKIVRLLIARLKEYRINIDTRNNKGFTAYLLASKYGNFFCAYMLKTEGHASDSARDTEFFLNAEEWAMKGPNGTEAKNSDAFVKEKQRILKHRSSMPPLRVRSFTSSALPAPQKPLLRTRSLPCARFNSLQFNLNTTIVEEPFLEEFWTQRGPSRIQFTGGEGSSGTEDCTPKRGNVLDLNKLLTYYEHPSTTPCTAWGPTPSKCSSITSCKDIYKNR